MIHDVGTGFQVIGLLHLVGIPMLIWWGTRMLATRFRASGAMGFGIAASLTGIVMFGVFVVLTPTSDRGMGIIVMLLYPALDALLAVIGVAAIVYSLVRGLHRRDDAGMEDAAAGDDVSNA